MLPKIAREALAAIQDRKDPDGNGYFLFSYNQCRAFLNNRDKNGNGSDTVHISGFSVVPDKRGSGHGKRGMQQICKWADEFGLTLRLWVERYDEGPISTTDLVKFYRKFGFKGDKDGMKRVAG